MKLNLADNLNLPLSLGALLVFDGADKDHALIMAALYLIAAGVWR